MIVAIRNSKFLPVESIRLHPIITSGIYRCRSEDTKISSLEISYLLKKKRSLSSSLVHLQIQYHIAHASHYGLLLDFEVRYNTSDLQDVNRKYVFVA